MKKLTLLLVLAMFGMNMFAQKDLNTLMKERGEYYFSLNIQQMEDLRAINELCSVDQVEGLTVVCYANVKQYERLLKEGYQPTLLTPPSLQEESYAMWDGSNRAEYDWDSYPTYSAYEDMMFQFQTDHPDKCEILTLGTLPSGRKIMVAHLNNGTGDGKPKFLYTSTIHGDETTGWILMLRLIDYLLENPDEPEVQTVMNNIDLFIGPNTNPDGTYHGGNNTVNGATRYNAHGVDMNRNYADPHGGPHPDGEEYQQETLWFMQLAEDYPFVMGANYHGGAEVMNYPWDNTYTLHADDAWYQLISHEYADLTHQVNPNYMSDYNNGITNGAQWYMIGGGRQDYMNGYAQCRELTIECSNTKLPNGSQLPSFWNYNKNSIFAFMTQCIYGIHGTITDKDTGEPLVATVTITGHDDNYSFVSSHLPTGDYHRPIKGGTYTVTYTANGYYPHQETVTVADGETVVVNVELEAGEGIMPDFTASMTDVSLGGSVNFTDQTWGANLASWEWTFEGGEPATSTVQNPTGIHYNAIGHYDVSLTVTNANGESATVTKHNFINVSEAYNMMDGTIQTCDALFFDDGGPNGNYGNNKDLTMTFRPATDGGIIEAVFTSFQTENNWDFLYIYDGGSINATQIGQYCGSNSPGTVVATNPEGALTFLFTSDGSVTESGWTATIRCSGATPDPLEVEVFADPSVINEGESSQLEAFATGGDGNYSYSWEPAESLSDAHIANPVARPTLPTEYTVTVTDGEGNTAQGHVLVDIRDVNVDESVLQSIAIYPNPTDGHLRIEGIRQPTHYTLTNHLGQVVVSGISEKDLNLDTRLEQGVYLLKLTNGSEVKVTKIIVK